MLEIKSISWTTEMKKNRWKECAIEGHFHSYTAVLLIGTQTLVMTSSGFGGVGL